MMTLPAMTAASEIVAANLNNVNHVDCILWERPGTPTPAVFVCDLPHSKALIAVRRTAYRTPGGLELVTRWEPKIIWKADLW